MTHKLQISDNLSLPIDIVTQAVAIVAKRRSGKSFLARRMAEQAHAAGQQICILDPKGDWWGIKSSRDGKSAGVPVVIFGGERAKSSASALASPFASSAGFVWAQRMAASLAASTTRDAYLQRLGVRRLVATHQSGGVIASAELFS